MSIWPCRVGHSLGRLCDLRLIGDVAEGGMRVAARAGDLGADLGGVLTIENLDNRAFCSQPDRNRTS